MTLFFEYDFNFKAQLFSCFYLTGLIWTIQSVHYPAYHYIDLAKFVSYQEYHTKWITPVVAPFMIIELITAFVLMTTSKSQTFWVLNFVGVIFIWSVTFFLSVPSHNRLMQGYDFKAAQTLILTNWFRTAFWSFRSLALFYIWIFKV